MTLSKLYHRLKPPIKLYWWRYEYPEKLNFGDEITPKIINNIWGRRCVWTPLEECEMIGAGSIIELSQNISTNKKIKVWGSGFIQDGPKNTKLNLEFLSVRGKLSRARVNSGTITLGDPGLLANLSFSPSNKKTGKIGVVAHYIDKETPFMKALSLNSNFLIIDPLSSVEDVIKQITSCELILSSSLHGLIVSDSFSIPNIWMPLSKNLTGGDYKFRDYYSAIGKKLTRIDLAKDDIFNSKFIDRLIKNYKPIKELERIQQELINTFPYAK